MSGKPYSIEAGGLRLAVRLTPRAASSSIIGVTEGADGKRALAIRIAAPPVEGAANAALIVLLAKSLRLSKSVLSIRSGETGRLKILHLAGDGAAIAASLDALLQDQ